jgi:hypothetical protein
VRRRDEAHVGLERRREIGDAVTKDQLWSGIVFSGLGAPFLLFGLLALVGTLRLKFKGMRTQGKVVGSERGVDPESSFPVVEFRDHNGQVRRVPLGMHSGSNRKGEIEIVYHRDHPQLARGTTFMHNWFVPIVCIGVGSACLVAAALSFLGLVSGEMEPYHPRP